MNEQDGHLMNVARMEALLKVAADYLQSLQAQIGYPINDNAAHRLVEREVEKIAPGCGRIPRD